MTESRHGQTIRELFLQALERPEPQRSAFLDAHCPADPAVRREIERLLAADTLAPDSFLALPEDSSAESAERRDTLVGARFGQFELVRRLATGGMGAIYEALQAEPHRPVALKVMRAGVDHDTLARRFRLEAEVLARLRHPHIAHIYDAGVHESPHGPLPYFAMELVPDAVPITRFAGQHKLTIRQRLELFLPVCDAVQHGHQRGVLHRDLKPGNILIDAAGQPKVVDFGAAKLTDGDVALTTQLTAMGELIGTIQYMSPEQCEGDPHELDTRSDVYSLGVVLYELLAGKLPYAATGSFCKAIRAIREAAPIMPATVDRRLRGNLQAILLKALEKNRDRRYQSAADLAADIRAHLRGDPITARPPGLWLRATRWTARHPIALTAIACAALVLATALALQQSVRTLHYSPHRVVIVGPEARLLSWTGNQLHSWRTPDGSDVNGAVVVRRPTAVGGGDLVLIAADRLPGCPDLALNAFDPSLSLDVPVWSGTLEGEPAFPDPYGRGYGPQDFNAYLLGVADVFPLQDYPNLPGKEIIAVHRNRGHSQCVIRIYDLAGHVLWQVWQDGGAFACYWLSGPRLLVLAANNADCYLADRGVADTVNQHPVVVFAVRPSLAVYREWLGTAAGDGPFDPVWYKALEPLGLPGLWESVEPQLRPRGLHTVTFDKPPVLDPANFVGVNIWLPRPLEKGGTVGVGFTLDSAGVEIPGSRLSNDEYLLNQALLPDPASIRLGTLPPCPDPPPATNPVAQP